MSFPMSKEPTLATVADYTFCLLKNIKNGGRVDWREWNYFLDSPYKYLQEILAIVGFCFTPIKSIGHFESYRETSELVWQYNQARRALQAMNLISENASFEESRKIILKEISLYIFISRKLGKEKRCLASKKHQALLERFLFFLYHLYGVICGYHRRRL